MSISHTHLRLITSFRKNVLVPSFTLKKRNIISNTAQVLLLCLKGCWPVCCTIILLGSRGHCASDEKNIDWLLNGISNADFHTNVTCRLVHYLQGVIFVTSNLGFHPKLHLENLFPLLQ